MYGLLVTSNTEEYVKLSGGFQKYKLPSMLSQFQHIDKEKLTISVSIEGGVCFPDILFQDGIYFISNKFKTILDNADIDYIKYKKVDIINNELGIQEFMYIMIVPAIDCFNIDVLDTENREFNWYFNGNFTPIISVDDIKISKKCINSNKLGYVSIFKIFGIDNCNIYLTQTMHDILKQSCLIGLMLYKI